MWKIGKTMWNILCPMWKIEFSMLGKQFSMWGKGSPKWGNEFSMYGKTCPKLFFLCPGLKSGVFPCSEYIAATIIGCPFPAGIFIITEFETIIGCIHDTGWMFLTTIHIFCRY